MNNHRLLRSLLVAGLLGGGLCSYGQNVITLEEIFEMAEVNSTQLRPYFTAQEEAKHAVDMAKTGYMPDLGISLSVSYIGDGFITKRNFADFQKAPIPHLGNDLSLNVFQPLYTGGAVKSAVEMAELQSTAARYATDFCRDNIRFRLAGFYLDIYKYTNLRHVVESNIGSAKKVLEEMQARHSQGTVIRNDIIRYELMISNLELQLVKINNILEILNANLVTTAGLPEGIVIVPDSTILIRVLPVEEEEWWQQEAETNAPALSLARSDADITRKAEDMVRSERLPKIGIQAGWNINGPILVEIPPIDRNLSYWYVGIGISYDISSLYKSGRSLAKSRAATKKKMEELVAAQENIAMAVKSDHICYMEAYEELKTQMKNNELADRNYNTVATRYSADMALITDMLDAADAKLDAETKLTNARINIIYYYYKLLFTTGKI